LLLGLGALAASVACASDIPLNTPLVPLTRWWLPDFGPEGDHICIDEASSENPGGRREGLIWYLPAADSGDRQALYRLFSEGAMDHMDSRTAGEGGYATEGILGFPWSAAHDGTAEIRRAYRASDGDHMTTMAGEAPAGYELERAHGWGFPRYGEDLTFGNGHHTDLVTIDNGRIEMSFDRVWGGVAYELWWNGRQFLNHWDSGRELQSALFKPGLGDVSFGPTEAGDMWGHGTPIIEQSATARSYYSRTLPLQWGPQSYGGGEHRPVVYGGEFERQATLGRGAGFDLIQWQVGYRPAESATYTREWVTAYVQPYVSARVFVYTAGVGFEERAMPACTESETVTIDHGAIVFASNDLHHAIALYTAEPMLASWYNFDCLGGQSSTRKINLWDSGGWMDAGTWYRKTITVVVGDISFLEGSGAVSPVE
jgi:hypothetical protein